VVVATALLATVISRERLRETTKIYLGGRKPGRHSKLWPAKYEAQVLFSRPQLLVSCTYVLFLENEHIKMFK